MKVTLPAAMNKALRALPKNRAQTLVEKLAGKAGMDPAAWLVKELGKSVGGKLAKFLGFASAAQDGGGPAPAARRVHATTFLRANAAVTSHVLMSPKLSDAQREDLIAYNRGQGYGVMYVYLANEGDYGGKSVAYDAAQKATWRKWLTKIREAGADVIVWMCADDSPGLAKRSTSDWSLLVTRFHEDCGDLVSEWVTGLECDERWSAGTTQALTRIIKNITGKPVGVHTTGIAAIGHAAGADVFYLQTGFGKSAAQIAALVKQAKSKFGGRVICAEYHKSGETDAAKKLGDAAIEAGADGVGNGCTAAGLSALRTKTGQDAPAPQAGGVLKSVAWSSYPGVKIVAPEIESWPQKTVDGKPCVAVLMIDGIKCEWIPKGRQASSVKNAMNKADAKYYRPDIVAGSTHAISVADVYGKYESNRLELTWP